MTPGLPVAWILESWPTTRRWCAGVAVACPWCGGRHEHGAGGATPDRGVALGTRVSHCHSGRGGGVYDLRWPDPAGLPGLLEATGRCQATTGAGTPCQRRRHGLGHACRLHKNSPPTGGLHYQGGAA